ncbi:MAG: hypothetical protein ABIL09_12385 [Gemmatimonadota bacterium]
MRALSARRALLLAALAVLGAGPLATAGAGPDDGSRPNVLFLHHSCGRNLIREGAVRELLTAAGVDFWDHDYNDAERGLTDAAGQPAGCYWIPDDNQWADGYAALFAQHAQGDDAPFARITAHHGVIAFKSCYPASDVLADDAQADAADPARKSLANYRRHYLAIRDVVDQMQEKTFVIVTQPPLHAEATNPDNARRARAWTRWLQSDEYLGGRTNLFVFDFFGLLADPDMLRSEYHRLVDRADSHPNARANVVCGARFADALLNVVEHRKVGGPRVTIDLAEEQGVLASVWDQELVLTGRAHDERGIARLTWTDLRGHGGELPSGETWRMPALQLAPGAARIVVTAWNRDGLRGSAAMVVRRLTEQPAEIVLFGDAPAAGRLNHCSVSDEQPAEGARHLLIEGTGEWQVAGLTGLNLDIAGLDPATACLEFQLDRGTDTTDYVSCGLNVGSLLIHPDSAPGYETFVIPFRQFVYLEDRITRFSVGAVWGEGARVRVDGVRVVTRSGAR